MLRVEREFAVDDKTAVVEMAVDAGQRLRRGEAVIEADLLWLLRARHTFGAQHRVRRCLFAKFEIRRIAQIAAVEFVPGALEGGRPRLRRPLMIDCGGALPAGDDPGEGVLVLLAHLHTVVTANAGAEPGRGRPERLGVRELEDELDLLLGALRLPMVTESTAGGRSRVETGIVPHIRRGQVRIARQRHLVAVGIDAGHAQHYIPRRCR